MRRLYTHLMTFGTRKFPEIVGLCLLACLQRGSDCANQWLGIDRFGYNHKTHPNIPIEPDHLLGSPTVPKYLFGTNKRPTIRNQTES